MFFILPFSGCFQGICRYSCRRLTRVPDIYRARRRKRSQENGTLDTEVIASKIATMACKMSIKGNQRVSLMEVEHLLDELMKLENPYQCPHGRPTIIKMSKYEIDKKFKRIV